MDWNNVFGIEEGERGRSAGPNFFVHSNQPGAVAVVSDDGVNVIPLDESNVVLRSMEEMRAEHGGVEVIEILEGQPPMEIVEEMSISTTEQEAILEEFETPPNPEVGQPQDSSINEDEGEEEEVSVEADSNGAEHVQVKYKASENENIPEMAEDQDEEEPDDAQLIQETDGNTEQVDSVVLKEESMELVEALSADVENDAELVNVKSAGEILEENQSEQSSHETCDMTAEVKVDTPSVIDTIVENVVVPPTKGIEQLQSTEDMPEVSTAARPVVLDAKTGQFVAILGGGVITVPELPEDHQEPEAKEPEVVEISDDEDYEILNDLFEDENDDIIYISDNEEDEAYKIQFQNARTMQRVKQSVDITAANYKPRFISREKLRRKHPRYAGLTFREIVNHAVVEDKVLPDFNEQVLPRKVIEKLRCSGHSIHKSSNGACVVTSKRKNIRMYHSSCSSRFDPVLADPVLENYVQEFRKSILPAMWRRRMFGSVEVDPSSVIPASIGSTGSSSIGSETDPECLATDEEESESELMQGSVAAWIIPDSIASRTPSPVEPDFDEPQFITTQVGSHTIVEGPPTKKRKQKHHEPQPHTDGKIYPKPAFSYSCLIAMALKNSKTGSLPVSEIYKFMCDHFPYFKSAPSGWKNSVRHNLSLNKCFEKIEKPGNGARKGCLWALNPAKIHKMDEEVQKWSRKDPIAIRKAMSDPENLELIEKGELKRDYSGAGASDDDEDEDFSEPATPLTPAQAQARRSRTNSSDSTLEGTTTVVTPVVTTVSQVHAALQRSVDSKSQLHLKREDSVELGTITTNLQGNYVCHTPTGNGTYTLSFANIGSSSPLTPIIIRRTPVK